jgi:predicted NAD/FAD-dependent oxidoreductase
MSKMSRRIVVDASVANSAGNGTHPTSRMCREFLLDMMTICHKVVVSQEISLEWKNHASSFSITWLAAMRAKRKIVTVNPHVEGSFVVRIQNASGFTSQQIAAMEKDLLLIAAALETDNLIASCDSKAKRLFAQAAVQIDDIKNIVWVNPNDEADRCGDWLKSGARHVPERSLGVSIDI